MIVVICIIIYMIVQMLTIDNTAGIMNETFISVPAVAVMGVIVAVLAAFLKYIYDEHNTKKV